MQTCRFGDDLDLLHGVRAVLQALNARPSHFDQPALAGLVLSIALTNVWNRFIVATRQVAGEWLKSAAAKAWA